MDFNNALNWLLCIWKMCEWALGCCSCPDLFRFFSTFFKIRGCQKNHDYKVWEKKLRFRGHIETFFTQDLVFVLFCAARWFYVKSLLLMSYCKIEHSLLVLYIQKNFSTTSETVYVYAFCLFFFRINSSQNLSRLWAGKLQPKLYLS